MVVDYVDNNIFNELKDIIIIKEDKVLKLVYGGNGDLYFNVIYEIRDTDEIQFIIDENDVAYERFNQLYNDIIKCNVYDDMELNKRLLLSSSYEDLVSNNRINWYSDDCSNDEANMLSLVKKDNVIILTFLSNENSRDNKVRICNSGSKYNPFNLCFMKLYRNMQALRKDNVKKLTKSI